MLSGQHDSTEFGLDSLIFGLPTGLVTIHEDENITSLMEVIADAELPLDGFRIQLYFGKKDEVNETRNAFVQQFPDYSAYVSWLQPNFRLRVGDFRTRIQAERFKNEILSDYPNCYIVRDHIEPTHGH